MAEIVYFLCAITSFLCAVLLIRSYQRTRSSLLMWSSLCFVAVALNNVLLVVDLVFIPVTIDLSVYRTTVLLGGLGMMLCGLIWEKA